MDVKGLLSRFDGRSRLLAHSLLSGVAGARSALTVLNRQRSSDPDFSLSFLLETLCQDEACLDDGKQTLTTKPLVCMFSEAFKRNLLCFLHLNGPALPRDSVLRLIRCLSQEANQNPWIRALIYQLHNDIGELTRETPLTPQCRERLKGLCDRFKDIQGKGRWASCFDGQATTLSAHGQEGTLDVESKKRKSQTVDLDVEGDAQQSKRMRMDQLSPKGYADSDGLVEDVEVPEKSPSQQADNGPTVESSTAFQSSTEDSLKELPNHVKAVVPLIKELLESEMEWDESAGSVLRVLNECDSAQAEVLCGMLGLSEAPERTLPQFCSCLLALTPDLSHSTAAVIIKNLLLDKVLSLTEPASRCLVTAATSLCSRYPRPACQTLIEPIIQGGHTGTAQAELLCRLIEDCFEPHHRLLVFQMILIGSWNEGVLSIIHALLDSKLELSEEIFSLFIDQLSSQSSHFTKSMKFAKMTLTILTKYQSNVNATSKHTLSCCLSSNETFLKKSLQAALNRICHL
ncbi:Fanconi anemia group E protein [Chanos chanos]|uniref:Fanconi anemia group E protein n=1 Tax=Chanos chanos TaxID=29144 RepID=A0A6J2W9Q4_CHACN|nr:Fanconi anemia group E protein [Chanos chanos]